MSGIELIPPAVTENTYLVIPCPQDKFGEFIAGLLGKPQVITRDFIGAFSIDRDDIFSLFELVQQRVREQQKATLVQFSVNTLYDDGSAVEVSSIEDFNSYAEVRPLVPQAVTMTWVYIATFANKDISERQQIDVSFNSGDNKKPQDLSSDEYHYEYVRREGRVFSNNVLSRLSIGHISFRISHTTRTWGMDVEGLLSSHIKNTIQSHEHAIRVWIRAKSVYLGIFAFVC